MANIPPHLDFEQSMKDVANKNLISESRVYANLSQEIIVTTEDKIRLCLIEHLSRMDRKNSWITPFAIFLTILVIFPTTTFHDFMNVSADTWKAIFMFAGLASLLWFIVSIRYAMISSSLNSIIAQIKKTSLPQKSE